MSTTLKRFLLCAVIAFQVAVISGRISMASSDVVAAAQHPVIGAIAITLDASEAPRKILHAHLVMPVKPGALTLLYPKWIPGEHGPTGPIDDLAGLRISAGGKNLPWRRDPIEMYAFHVEVPANTDAIDISLDFLLPASPEGFSSGASATANLAVLSWNQVLLYPEGYSSDELTYKPSLRVPSGWKIGTALPLTNSRGINFGSGSNPIEFKTVSLTTLVDSPVITGSHFRTIKLTDSAAPSFQIDMVSDSEAALQMDAEQIANYSQLVVEANSLFGAHHYEHYHFLYTLSDYVAHFGLEHHESSDDRVAERTLLDEPLRKASADLLPHEFVHSWNGKYRRPAGLATPDYEQPMQGELLWVYEGLTEYLGSILAARSGLRSAEDQREHLANIAAYLDRYPGREWRPLIDTTVAAQLLYNAPGSWFSWRRGVDFYDEGELIWLEADTVIRQQTKGAKSLDDFCKRFHGAPSTQPMVKPYTFDDVVNTMNDITPYDWRTFFTTRLNAVGTGAPLGGITNGGWKLIYSDQQSDYQKALEGTNKVADLSYSVGFRLGEDGGIGDVVMNTPAYVAGLGPGMKIIAVNGNAFTVQSVREAIVSAKGPANAIELLIQNGPSLKTYRIDYHGGERYPRLERDTSHPDLLQQITKPLKARK